MKKALKILLKIFLWLLVTVLVLFILVQLPPVQNYARKKVVGYLQKKLDTRVEVGSLYIGLPSTVVIEGVYVEDKLQDTLLYGGRLRVNISLFRLLRNEINISKIHLEHFTAKITRSLPDTVYNFQFIVDAFAREEKKEPKPGDTTAMKISLGDLMLNDVRFIYQDTLSGSNWVIWVGDFDTYIRTFDPEHMLFNIPSISLKGLTARMYQYKPLVKPLVDVQPEDSVAASLPVLKLDDIDLADIDVDYRDYVAAFFTQTKFRNLEVRAREFSLTDRRIRLDNMRLDGVDARVLLGKNNTAEKQEPANNTGENDEAGKNWYVSADNFRLTGSKLKFDNENMPRQPRGMDYAHLDAGKISLRAKTLVYNGDTIALSIQQASLTEKSGLDLQQLEGDFLYTPTGAQAENFLVKTPGTRIRQMIKVSYSSLESLQEHLAQMQVQAELTDCYVQTKDILIFAPGLQQQPLFADPSAVYRINARLSGRIGNLVIHTLQARAFKNTVINVNGNIAGLPSTGNLRGRLRINNIHTTSGDMAVFLPDTIRRQWGLPANLNLQGFIEGNGSNAQADLRLRSSSGNLAVSGFLNNYKDTAAARYNLQVRTEQLQAGYILKNESLQNISTTFQLSGQGLTTSTADARLTGMVQSFGFRNYTYTGIPVEARIQQQQAGATLSIKDPNIHFALQADADLSGEYPAVKAELNIDSIKAGPLHLLEEQLIYRGKIFVDMASVNPDRPEGNINIVHSLLVWNGERRLMLDTVRIQATQQGDTGTVSFQSAIVNARITGKYQLRQLGNVFQQAIQPYFATMPSQPAAPQEPYDFSISVSTGNNDILQDFIPPMPEINSLALTGHFSSDSAWNAALDVPLLAMSGLHAENLQLQAGVRNDSLVADISARQLNLAGNSFYGLAVRAAAADNKLVFSTAFNDPEGLQKYSFSGLVEQHQAGQYHIHLDSSAVLNYEKWSIAGNNTVTISDQGIRVTDFILNRNFQQLSVKSRGEGMNAPVEAYFSSFHVATLAAFILPDSIPVDGVLDGEILFRDLMKQPSFTGDVTINNLSVKNDTLGNVAIKANNTTAGTIQADLTLTGRGNELTLAGNYYTTPVNGNELNMKLNIGKLNLASIEGVTLGNISNASGYLSGQFTVTGTAAKPVVNGKLGFNQAAFNLTMLNGYFTIDNETITVNREGIRFDSFRIKDSANNTASIDGMVYTSDFSGYRFNVNIRARNFTALNTTKKDNDLYYGKLVFSSNMSIRGTDKAPVIDGSVTIEDKTDLTVVLPQREPGVVSREGIVEFVDMDAPGHDTLFMKKMARFDSLNTTDVTGLDVSANIEVKKEAVFSMIVDPGNGDFLRMQGEGLLNGAIDKSGKVTLSGSYEIKSGTYELTFNFLRRKFSIQEGSRIVWSGEPTTADLDVTAVYTANTAALDLVENQLESVNTASRNMYRQRMPFEVQLKLQGELLQPQVTFNIVLPENKNYRVPNEVVTTVQTKLSQLRQEPSELNKQVFALLLLNRFVSENPFESSSSLTAEHFARQSASKLLTEQLNQLAADLVEGVDINFDVSSMEDYSTGTAQNRTELNVALSKRLLNDRLTVTVGSNFELEGAAQSSAPGQASENASNLAGNIALNYMLSKDGRYMLRAYRKNEYEGVIDGYIVETGVGFIITLDYNRFRNLFLSKKAREERRERRRERRQEEEKQ